jgi:hypothetical protein
LGEHSLSSFAMKLDTADSKTHGAWRRLRRCLEYVRDWPERSDNPYSLVSCLSLLLALGLIVEIGPWA